MSEYTPGPWRAERQVDKRGLSLGWIINHENGRIGWSDYATCYPNKGERQPHPIGEANAHLIAAAPALLAALEGVVRVADRATDEFDAARAAIRQAKGES